MNGQFKSFLVFFILLLFLVLVGIELGNASRTEHKDLEIFFLDVGQGDATLIQYKGTFQVLIDGGQSGNRLEQELAKVMPFFDRKIELVVATHPDKDHIGGLPEILSSFVVDGFFHNGQVSDTQAFESLSDLILEKEISSHAFGEGSKISVGNDLSLVSFNPDFAAVDVKEKNEFSVVLRVDYGDNSFLLTGDADFDTEEDMISDEEDIDVDWLKVGHHGSKNSTLESFLKAVSPAQAVISVGKGNSFGHPSPELLERLEKASAKVFRTDERGTVAVKCPDPKQQCFFEGF